MKIGIYVLGYRSAQYYIVVVWSRIAASGVPLSRFCRPPRSVGNKVGKRAKLEGKRHDLLANYSALFRIVSILISFVCRLKGSYFKNKTSASRGQGSGDLAGWQKR